MPRHTPRTRPIARAALLLGVASMMLLAAVNAGKGEPAPAPGDAQIEGDVIWLSDHPRVRNPEDRAIARCGTRAPFIFEDLGILIDQDGNVLFNNAPDPINISADCRSLLYRTGTQQATSLVRTPNPSGGYRSTIINAEGKSRTFEHDVMSAMSSGWYFMSYYRLKPIAERAGYPDRLQRSVLIDPLLREHTQYNYTRNAGPDDPRLLWAGSGYALVTTNAMFTLASPNGVIHDLTSGETKRHACSAVVSEPYQFERQGRLVTIDTATPISSLYDPVADRVLYESDLIADSRHETLLIASPSRRDTERVLIDRDGNELLRFEHADRAYTLTRSGIVLWYDRAISGSAGMITDASRAERDEDGRWRLLPLELPRAPLMPTQHPDRFVRGTPDGDEKALLDESLRVVFEIPSDEHPIYVTHDAKLVTYNEPEHAYVLYDATGAPLKRFDMAALGFPRAPASD